VENSRRDGFIVHSPAARGQIALATAGGDAGATVILLGPAKCLLQAWLRESLYNVAVTIVVRDYKPEDFESLWRMDQECFPRGMSYSKQELNGYMGHRGSFTLVATDGKEKLQGFIVAHCAASGHVITIDVGPGARRAGVGSRLLRAAEDRMRAAGCRAVGLEAAVDNVTALSFYKRHGYDVIRTWPRYYSNGVDALVLKKDLN